MIANNLHLPTLLEVAISLVLIFFIFSMFVSGITEFINSVWFKRAEFLSTAISRILKPKLTAFLYQHPLVASMAKKPDDKPSYLSAKVFAQATIDIIIQELKKNDPNAAITLEAIKKTAHNLPEGIKNEVKDEVFQLLDALSHDIETGKNELNHLRINLETWYNDYMDRVSGWYKNHTQKVLWIIAFVVTIALNIDSVNLTKHLYSDKPLREALVQEAVRVTEQPTDAMSPKTDSSLIGQATRLKTLRQDVEAMQLPIGWNSNDLPQNFIDFLIKLLGFLITTAALSFGAPFWFDLLIKLVNIRNTGNKPS